MTQIVCMMKYSAAGKIAAAQHICLKNNITLLFLFVFIVYHYVVIDFCENTPLGSNTISNTIKFFDPAGTSVCQDKYKER